MQSFFKIPDNYGHEINMYLRSPSTMSTVEDKVNF